MSEQNGSMQLSGDLGQSRSSSSGSSSGGLPPVPFAQTWAQPARMLSQLSSAFGQMPVRMLEQEASMMQRSFVSSNNWLPNVLNVWEEPFVMLRKLSEDMDQFVSRLMQGPFAESGQKHLIGKHQWTPTVDMSQLANEIVIRADLPGLTRSDVKLQLHDDSLTIEGERHAESRQQGEGYHRVERVQGRFFRSIPLPDGIDAPSVHASMRDGVLEITVPLKHREQGVKLEIRDRSEEEQGEHAASRRELPLSQSQPPQPQRQNAGAASRAEVKA
ncbi:Hsp20/alpha crystallin family protein [Actimicrobium sp. CCI2.3]|uniref:Hsp20/alpha crystallin family protein n=1 Tax=Actimicrobium sp. CCI2.3 TaxID=3048616 RepID=UPI002AB54D9A|nr:Hsp20/alpha crystallin family protein [Actimicrobium sp. CCI2.3]MDY7573877.1 Hsp20/alpha crystallin family protein [Actimicrobium sp. CCI2.3]MEB0023401.1 Hsp20/alpha crystallin family protein [Actimicrobium sp. CCI2.3]